MTTLDKVTAFITRNTSSGRQILLLRHPYAGYQFPAGTVEEGESFESAVLREVGEETGLKQAFIVNQLGELNECFPGRLFFLKAATVFARPDESSFDWARLPRGAGVDYLRDKDGFLHVTFKEGDVYPNPSYTTYQITGWVREEHLTSQLQRRFFHLTTSEETPDTWQRRIDKHIFTLLWVQIENMPEIVWPQSEYWLKFGDRITNT